MMNIKTLLTLSGLLATLSFTAIQAQDHHECSPTCEHHLKEAPQLDPSLEQSLKSHDALPRLAGFLNHDIPIVFRHSAQSALEYYVLNFWKYYPFIDTSLVGSPYPGAMLQAFVGNILGVDTLVLEKALTTMLDKAQVNSRVYDDFTNVYERLVVNFFPLNLSLNLHQQLINHRRLTGFYSSDQMASMDRALTLRLNCQEGMSAPDCLVWDVKKKAFSILDSKEPILVLVFTELDSPDYITWYELLQNSLIPEAQAKGYLKVLHVFIADQKPFKKHVGQFKDRSIAMIPPTLRSQIPYDLSERPAVYVLDEQRYLRLINPTFNQLNDLVYDSWMFELKQ